MQGTKTKTGDRVSGVPGKVLTGAWSLRNSYINILNLVQDLGITLDREISFSLHINQLTRTGRYYTACQFRVVSHSLACDTAATVIHAFVTSRLDHCCLILAGLQQF